MMTALVPKKPSGLRINELYGGGAASGNPPALTARLPPAGLPGTVVAPPPAPAPVTSRNPNPDHKPIIDSAALGPASSSSAVATAPTLDVSTLTCLTAFERQEIMGYEHACFYAGQMCRTKIDAPLPDGAPNYGYDDDKGDYLLQLEDHIAYRYQVVSMLGRGSFGQVVRCIDHKDSQRPIALKIIRNKKRFHQQAQIEIKILSHLRHRDPEGKYGIIRLLDTFVFRSHVCLTYELLSINLYEYMKLNRFHPLPLTVVKKIGASILISLAFMWRENIVHCDLKPENVLLRHPNRTGVKVIDLGSACFESEKLYSYIQSRFYRAPEVILHLNYGKKIDLWSFACVLCELAAGYPLFPGENEVEQLACMWETLGLPPKHVIAASPRRSVFFEEVDNGEFEAKVIANSRRKMRYPGTRSLAAFLSLPESDPFIEFVSMFLRWDPDDRPAPEPAMRHPWICDAYVGVPPRVPVAPVRSSNSTVSAASLRSSAPPIAPHPPQIGGTSTAAPAAQGGGGGTVNLPLITPRTVVTQRRPNN